MKQEDKELLLKDLCARLPYGVKCKIHTHVHGDTIYKLTDIRNNGYTCGTVKDKHAWAVLDISEVKPYLFPLSSMTEEQKEELKSLGWNFDNFEIHNVSECLGTYREYVSHSDCFVLIDWFNKNHFDYRGLIEKELAIDATGLNIY